MKRFKSVFTFVALLAAGLGVIGQSQTPQVFAPIIDRIGFPVGYQGTFKLLYAFDHFQNRQIRVAYANDVATSAKPGQPFPYGSILIGEFYPALRDAQGEPALDEKGRFIPGGLPTIFVMRKELGFGSAYGPFRTGEWEYVAYRTDGTVSTPPERTGAGSCAECHQFAGAQKDWVFRFNMALTGSSGALPDGVLKNYRFLPGTIRAKVGLPITLYNVDDADFHDIVADDGSFDSGRILLGGSFTVTPTQPGSIDFHCSHHPRMRGTIVVER